MYATKIFTQDCHICILLYCLAYNYSAKKMVVLTTVVT